MHGPEGLSPVHAGHGEVHEDQIEPRPGLAEAVQGLDTVLGREDLEPHGLERIANGLEDELLVIHQEHAPPELTLAVSLWPPCRRDGVFPRGGKADPEQAATVYLTGDLKPSPVPLEDAEHGREAKAPPGGLGGEEGVKDPRHDISRHAAAGIFHFK